VGLLRNAQYERYVPGTRARGDSWSHSSKAVQPSSTDADDSSSLGDAGGEGHSTVSLGSMQAIDGLGVRCPPSGSASKHATSTRAASANKIFQLLRPVGTHIPSHVHLGPPPRNSRHGWPVKPVGVIDVGNCYPA